LWLAKSAAVPRVLPLLGGNRAGGSPGAVAPSAYAAFLRVMRTRQTSGPDST